MVESLREWGSRKGNQKWTLPVSVVTLINIPSDRASIPFDEDNGAENISWKRATTFSSDFMVLRMRESTDCSLFAVFLNECKGIHPFSYMWNRLFFPHELQKEEWCSLKKHMPVASHLTPLNNQRTYRPPCLQCSWAFATRHWRKRSQIIQKRQRRGSINQRLCTGDPYLCLQTASKQAWSHPTLSPSYLISNGLANSLNPTNTTISPDYLCHIDWWAIYH